MNKLKEIIKHNSILIGMMMIVVVSVLTGINSNHVNGVDNESITICPEPELVIIDSNKLNLVMETQKMPHLSQEIETYEKIEETTEEETTTEEITTEEPTTTAPQRVVPCSDEDYINLLHIVEAEATGGDVMSKMIVADVIINRVRDYRFPNTITEVILQGNGDQFSPVRDGRFYSVPVTAGTVEAVERALLGEDYSYNALFFASVASVNAGGWHAKRLTRLFEYGGHVYFTF